MESSAEGSGWHVWIARIGVLAIAVVAFLFVYDAGVTFAGAVGYRVGLGKLWPWLIEGFLALVVYAGSLIRQRGGSVAYPVTLFCILLSVSGYMNVRVHTHHGGPLELKAVESGSASALPVLILAASVHLLLRTFEQPRHSGSDMAQDDPMPVGLINQPGRYSAPAVAPAREMDALAFQESAPEPLADWELEALKGAEESLAAQPETFSREELDRIPEPEAPRPQLRGQSAFLRMAEAAKSASARQAWLAMANESHPQGKLF